MGAHSDNRNGRQTWVSDMLFGLTSSGVEVGKCLRQTLHKRFFSLAQPHPWVVAFCWEHLRLQGCQSERPGTLPFLERSREPRTRTPTACRCRCSFSPSRTRWPREFPPSSTRCRRETQTPQVVDLFRRWLRCAFAILKDAGTKLHVAWLVHSCTLPNAAAMVKLGEIALNFVRLSHFFRLGVQAAAVDVGVVHPIFFASGDPEFNLKMHVDRRHALQSKQRTSPSSPSSFLRSDQSCES